MATRVLEAPTQEITAESPVTSLQEIAETIQIDALQHAHTKAIQPMRAADLETMMQRHDFMDHYKYGLAERMAKTLAAHDKSIQTIHYFDPNLNSDASTETYLPLDPSVNLLIQVESKSAALTSFIAAFDKAMAEQARKLPTAQFAGLETILNAIVITREDVEQGRGYAVLLSSFYLKPRQIW